MSDIYAEIAKINPDRQEVFGWASVTKRGGKPVVDLQEDYIEVDELEKSAYEYVLNSRVGGEMHQRMGKAAPKQIGTLIESFVVTPEKVEKMGLPQGSLPDGWWIGFKVNDGDVWKSVKDGKYTGFSIHGRGVRKRESLEEDSNTNNTREQLLKAAFASAADQVEFTKNLAGIADALHEREHPEAHYFGEVVKHLIGSHEQKDHAPGKYPGAHSRSEHGDSGMKAKHGAAAGAAALGGMALLRGKGAAQVAELMGTSPGVVRGIGAASGASGGAQLGYNLAGGQVFGNPSGSRGAGIAAGTGNVLMDPIGVAGRRIIHGSPNKKSKTKKSLSKKEYETLAKYLG